MPPHCRFPKQRGGRAPGRRYDTKLISDSLITPRVVEEVVLISSCIEIMVDGSTIKWREDLFSCQLQRRFTAPPGIVTDCSMTCHPLPPPRATHGLQRAAAGRANGRVALLRWSISRLFEGNKGFLLFSREVRRIVVGLDPRSQWIMNNLNRFCAMLNWAWWFLGWRVRN